MKLYDGTTYWDQTVQEPVNFGKLTGPIETDVLIIGGGMSGSLCAYILSLHGRICSRALRIMKIRILTWITFKITKHLPEKAIRSFSRG